MSGPVLAARDLRMAALTVAAAEAVFWVYSIIYVIRHANPMGDGMELVAIMPLSVLFGALTLPALLLARGGRWIKTSVAFALASGVANFLLWQEILYELSGAG
jgi:hypothetical protein